MQPDTKRIIKKELSLEDLYMVALGFLKRYPDLDELSRESFLNANLPLEERLQFMFLPYFEVESSSRYGYIVDNMNIFCSILESKSKELRGAEKALFIEYWRFITQQIKSEASSFNDNRFNNSLIFFESKVDEITT